MCACLFMHPQRVFVSALYDVLPRLFWWVSAYPCSNIQTQQLHQSSLLSPLISPHPPPLPSSASCSLAIRSHLLFLVHSFLFRSPPLCLSFTSVPLCTTIRSLSFSGSCWHFALVLGQSSTSLLLLLLLVSCILKLSRHHARTVLSPPHPPTVNETMLFFL